MGLFAVIHREWNSVSQGGYDLDRQAEAQQFIKKSIEQIFAASGRVEWQRADCSRVSITFRMGIPRYVLADLDKAGIGYAADGPKLTIDLGQASAEA